MGLSEKHIEKWLAGRRPSTALVRRCLIALLLLLGSLKPVAADPAVAFMQRFANDALAAARQAEPVRLQGIVGRYADTHNIGLFALGDYRPRLEARDRQSYLDGMVRFIGRYAANQAPNYPVTDVRFAPESRRARYGQTVDSTITLRDGSVYEVSWLLTRVGSTFKIRDAQVVGFWLTSFLKDLFEKYVSENNGSVRALVAGLQGH